MIKNLDPMLLCWLMIIDDGQAKLFVDLFQAQRGDQLEVVGQSDIVLLAVKPHQIGEVLRNTAQAWKPGQL